MKDLRKEIKDTHQAIGDTDYSRKFNNVTEGRSDSQSIEHDGRKNFGIYEQDEVENLQDDLTLFAPL
jgi:hypothetical protein